MGTFNANILPASTGFSLGSSSQQWIINSSTVNATTIQSNTPVAALSGTVRLSGSDTVSWRNAANGADVSLSKTGAASGTVPADVLAWNGGAIEGVFVTPSLNPSATGELRLASGDAINFRNNANGADINGLSKNSSDVVVIGGTAGASFNGPISAATVSTVGGFTIPTGGLTVGAGGATIAGNSTVTGSLTATSLSSSTTLSVGTNATITGLVTSYNGIATDGSGIVAISRSISQQSNSAASTVATMVPPAIRGSYRVRFVMSVGAANTATLGWTLTWTDSNGNAQAPTNMSLFKAGTAAPALTFSATAGDAYYGYADIDIDNSIGAINVKVTFSGTSFTAKCTATIERLV